MFGEHCPGPFSSCGDGMTGWFNSFRIRLTLFFGALSMALGLGLFLYITQVSSESMTNARGETLRGLTGHIADVLAETLRERERELWLLSQSPMFVDGPLDGVAMRRRLDQVKASYRHYAWLGVADAAGMIQSAADGLLIGQNVDQRPWFQEGRKGRFVGDIHEAVLLAKKLAALPSGEPLRFVDFAAPIHDARGELRGVLAAHAHWQWVAEVINRALPANAEGEKIEALIFSADGRLLHPYEEIGQLSLPAQLKAGENSPTIVEWSDDGRYLTSNVVVRASTRVELGWRVVLRQPVQHALAPVARMQRSLILLGLFTSAVFMLLAYRLAVAFSRPVEQLAVAARRIERGDEQTHFRFAGRTLELRGLAASLEGMTSTLLANRQALEASNASLEQKVEERTAELTEANQQLSLLARRDALTGLHNRLAATERLREEFLRAQRSGKPYALLLLDVDYFKKVNDTHGHAVGDAVLKHVASLLGVALRQTDFVARYGGEEFLVLLPECDRSNALLVAEKIRQRVASATVPGVGHITLSCGVAMADVGDQDEDLAVRLADQALYQAKDAGRNRVVFQAQALA
ncbi:diguanylate cyclase [Pseudomonas benzenivorans]|uniref:diguanylate cyclase n=1 Tax=Pseudomonas benzenivorans TaxID=556533 RepID=A0ABZ0PQZ7_9PSED|nr:diguanylate cyclase [Pseudomonas benzenivorans]WPC03206.1 diguanylate cyclase [Pseudomonas benzenivorans]